MLKFTTKTFFSVDYALGTKHQDQNYVQKRQKSAQSTEFQITSYEGEAIAPIQNYFKK